MGDRHTLVIGGRKYTRTSPTQWDFHRGFVRTATVSAESFPALSEGLFARELVQPVRLTNRGLGDDGFAEFARADFGSMRVLRLISNEITDRSVALLRGAWGEQLEVLELSGNSLSAGALATLRKRFGARLVV
jgi:hypothetical protein